MRARRHARATAVVALAVGLIAAAAPPASAHYLSSKWITSYRTRPLCVDNYTEVSHSSSWPGGHFISGLESTKYNIWLRADCAAGETRWRHDHYQRIWKWNGSRWSVCDRSGWFSFTRDHQTQLQRRSAYPPCGDGYYTMESITRVFHDLDTYDHDPEFHGMTVRLWEWSSTWYHWLPA